MGNECYIDDERSSRPKQERPPSLRSLGTMDSAKVAQSDEAGPSRPVPRGASAQHPSEDEEMMEIPSTGLQFFEYRRRLFLAGLPLPATPSSSTHLPPTIIIPRRPPSPKPVPPALERETSQSVGRLEWLLKEEGNEEMQRVWDAGVGAVAKHLHAGKRLAKGLRLGLVIKVLKASWIQDGLWPVDSRTGRPSRPPDSPLIQGVELFPDGQETQR
ncbi:hypothetical protein IAU60_004118 [Kwoniella sp. DSM 27419]